MNDVEIVKKKHESGGRFIARVAGYVETAELTYITLDSSRVIADHTGVPASLEGKGVGKALVAHLVEDAKSNGYRIVPQCWFVNILARRTPAWSDVFVEISDQD